MVASDRKYKTDFSGHFCRFLFVCISLFVYVLVLSVFVINVVKSLKCIHGRSDATKTAMCSTYLVYYYNMQLNIHAYVTHQLFSPISSETPSLPKNNNKKLNWMFNTGKHQLIVPAVGLNVLRHYRAINKQKHYQFSHSHLILELLRSSP